MGPDAAKKNSILQSLSLQRELVQSGSCITADGTQPNLSSLTSYRRSAGNRQNWLYTFNGDRHSLQRNRLAILVIGEFELTSDLTPCRCQPAPVDRSSHSLRAPPLCQLGALIFRHVIDGSCTISGIQCDEVQVETAIDAKRTYYVVLSILSA